MRTNEHTALSTSQLLLVPYSSHHVPTYHSWMQDAELQAATASEPLSLEEEHAMQRSWRNDHDKLTFIICLVAGPDTQLATTMLEASDRPEQMIGDINLFLFESDNKEDPDNTQNQHKAESAVGEIELMIARKDQRKKGYGRLALSTFMKYILSNWPQIAREYGSGAADVSDSSVAPAYLRVKINHTNIGSIRLFKSLDFQSIAEEPNYFGEIELRWRPNKQRHDAYSAWGRYQVLDYQPCS